MKIKLLKTKYHRFAFESAYSPEVVDFCKALKETYGWQKFSFEASEKGKFWVFSEPDLIGVIRSQYPHTVLEPEVQEIVLKEVRWLALLEQRKSEIEEIKLKTETDFHVPGMKKEMYAYQKIGVEFLIKSGGKAIIADSMGLGKTVQAIAYVKYSGFNRVLVVSPASVKGVWENEVKKWTNLKTYVIDSKTDLSDIPADIHFWIINYDLLKKMLPQLLKIHFDCIIADEAHFVKSLSAIRSKVLRQLSRVTEKLVLLTGTPLLSRPSELFSLLNMVDQKNWSNFREYTRKYCDIKMTRYGVDISGASNTAELHERIKRYFIRRHKDDVLKELPPKILIDVPSTLDKDTWKQYELAERNLASYLRSYQGKQPPDIAKMLQAEKLAKLGVLRMLSSMGKVKMAIEFVESIIESGDKVLVFGSFQEPLDRLKEVFKDKAVMITGRTPINERGGIVEAFQKDKNIQVFLGGFKSAGVGLTLTAASNFVALDLPWNPADLQQSIDRCHRIGSTANSVNVFRLIAPETIDEDMRNLLDEKQDTFDKVIDGKSAENMEKTMIDVAVEGIQRRHK